MDVGMAEAGQPCDEPVHREEEGRPHQDVLTRDHGIWGSAPYRWALTQLIRTPSGQDGRLSRARGSHVGLV